MFIEAGVNGNNWQWTLGLLLWTWAFYDNLCYSNTCLTIEPLGGEQKWYRSN